MLNTIEAEPLLDLTHHPDSWEDADLPAYTVKLQTIIAGILIACLRLQYLVNRIPLLVILHDSRRIPVALDSLLKFEKKISRLGMGTVCCHQYGHLTSPL